MLSIARLRNTYNHLQRPTSRSRQYPFVSGTSAEWPAMLEVTPPNTTISYNNNETVHINCTATGYPKLNVRWVKVEGSEDRVTDFNSTESMKSPSTSTLTMSSSTSILTLKDKGGKYRCVGVSSTGNELVHDVIVYGILSQTNSLMTALRPFPSLGLVAPRVTLSTTPSPARLGKKVTINCTVLQGFPQPLLSLAIPKCKECVSPKKGLFLVHKMSFGRNDLGKQYKCLAVNRAGTDEKTHVASGKTLYSFVAPLLRKCVCVVSHASRSSICQQQHSADWRQHHGVLSRSRIPSSSSFAFYAKRLSLQLYVTERVQDKN